MGGDRLEGNRPLQLSECRLQGSYERVWCGVCCAFRFGVYSLRFISPQTCAVGPAWLQKQLDIPKGTQTEFYGLQLGFSLGLCTLESRVLNTW